MKWGAKRMRKRGVRVIEITKIGGIDRGTWKYSRGKRGQGLSRVLDKRGSGVAVTTDKIGSIAGGFNYLIRSSFAVSKFSDGTGRSIAIDLNTGHNKVADGESNRGAGFIGTLAVDSTALFGEQAEDLLSKLGSRCSKAKEGMDGRGLVRCGGRSRAEA
jgi:hypothetical protein